MSLDEQLAALSPSLLTELRSHGFDPERLKTWAKSVGTGTDDRNRLKGRVAPPGEGDILDAPVPGTPEHERLTAVGLSAISKGEVALCLLAGGMATRMGGVVKSLVEVFPGKTFLDLRLDENRRLARLGGRPFPLWLMTSEATDAPIREALAAAGVDPAAVATFQQFVSLRLTQTGELFIENGEPSVHATGHGDLPDALRQSGLLSKFVARGGKTVCIANIDNLGATVDPAILGFHLDHGAPITVELVDKVGTDRGGGPIRHDDKPIITEEFRLPKDFDAKTIPVFNTNTFLVRAEDLARLTMPWTYVEVVKTIGERKAVQFERLIGEMTSALASRFLRVPRDGDRSRFLPVKDVPELESRRGQIRDLLRSRGILTDG